MPLLGHGLGRCLAAWPTWGFGVTAQHAVLLSNLVAVEELRAEPE